MDGIELMLHALIWGALLSPVWIFLALLLSLPEDASLRAAALEDIRRRRDARKRERKRAFDIAQETA